MVTLLMERIVSKSSKKLGKSARALLQNVQSLMEKAGWNQAEFARKLKVAPTNVSNYLSGKNLPTIDSLEEIADVFGVSVAELFKADVSPEPRIYKADLPETVRVEIANVRAEVATGNAKLKDEINQMLLPFLAKLKGELGVEEVVVRAVPKEKLSSFLSAFLRDAGLSADFYLLLDKNADTETLRVEFLREVGKALLSADESTAAKAKKVISELADSKGRKK